MATVNVWLSWALTGVFSSSRPLTVTVLVTVPAFSTPVVNVKVKLWFCASTIGLPPLAAMASSVRSPSTSSMMLVMVTGSVLAVLVFLIVKL